MSNTTTTTTCDTCERPSVATYSDGSGTTETYCGYHEFKLTRRILICTTCDEQKYVGKCFCDN